MTPRTPTTRDVTIFLWRRRGDVTPLSILPVGLSSPLALMASALHVLSATGLCLGGFSIPGIPALLAAVLAAVLVGGAACIIAGLYWRTSEHTGRAVEQAGHAMASSAWAGFSLALLLFALGPNESTVIPALQAAVLSAGGIGRFRALAKVNRAMRVAHTARSDGGPSA